MSFIHQTKKTARQLLLCRWWHRRVDLLRQFFRNWLRTAALGIGCTTQERTTPPTLNDQKAPTLLASDPWLHRILLHVAPPQARASQETSTKPFPAAPELLRACPCIWDIWSSPGSIPGGFPGVSWERHIRDRCRLPRWPGLFSLPVAASSI